MMILMDPSELVSKGEYSPNKNLGSTLKITVSDVTRLNEGKNIKCSCNLMHLWFLI